MLVIAKERELAQVAARRSPPGLPPGAFRPLAAWHLGVRPGTDHGLPVMAVDVFRAPITMSIPKLRGWRHGA